MPPYTMKAQETSMHLWHNARLVAHPNLPPKFQQFYLRSRSKPWCQVTGQFPYTRQHPDTQSGARRTIRCCTISRKYSLARGISESRTLYSMILWEVLPHNIRGTRGTIVRRPLLLLGLPSRSCGHYDRVLLLMICISQVVWTDLSLVYAY